MRYSIVGATPEYIMSLGGTNIKSTHFGLIVFADLSVDQVQIVESKGYKVEKLTKIKLDSRLVPTSIGIVEDIAPPIPIEAVPVYTPAQLFAWSGFEQARSLTDPPLYGEGINIAIVDSGIRATHELVGVDRVVYSKNYTTSPAGDSFNHGTGVASVLLAAVPKCSILDLKVLSDIGTGTVEELVLAIDDCIALHDEDSIFAPRIINLSLGTEDIGDPTEPLRIICREAIARNIWIFAAAGNSGPYVNTVMSPAAERYVFAVGSCKFDPFEVNVFSSRGPSTEGLTKPDVVFFGENIVVASSRGDVATVAKSGTSYSTPFVSGIAAMYQEAILIRESEKYPEELFETLAYDIWKLIRSEDLMDTHLAKFCVKPSGSPYSKDNDYGYGLPYGTLFLRVMEPSPVLTFDITPLISAAVTIGMVGMMIGIIK